MKLQKMDWDNEEFDLELDLQDEKLHKIRNGFCKNWDIAKGVLTVLQLGAKKPLVRLVLSIAIRIGDSVYKNKCEV